MFVFVKKKLGTGVASACVVASLKLVPLGHWSVGLKVSVRPPSTSLTWLTFSLFPFSSLVNVRDYLLIYTYCLLPVSPLPPPLWASWAHEGKDPILFFLVLSRCSPNCGMNGWMHECFKGEKGIWEVLNQSLPPSLPRVRSPSPLHSLSPKILQAKLPQGINVLLVYSLSGWFYLYIYKSILCACWCFVCESFIHSRASVRRNLAWYLWHCDRKWHHDRAKSDEVELSPVEAVSSMTQTTFPLPTRKA